MHNHPKIIGLTGPAGSGKDSVADAIVHLTGATRIAFADALRAEVCAAFGVPLAYLTNRETKEHPISALALARCTDLRFVRWMQSHGVNLNGPRSPRWVMQQWGTEYRRRQDSEYWCKKVVRRIGSALHIHKSPLVVLTDVRFADEAITATDLGGVIWQVQRPGYVVPADAHASETTGAEFMPDRVIDNSEGLPELLERARDALGVFYVAVEGGAA